MFTISYKTYRANTVIVNSERYQIVNSILLFQICHSCFNIFFTKMYIPISDSFCHPPIHKSPVKIFRRKLKISLF